MIDPIKSQVVWNPAVGCSPVSDGCRNCYAVRVAWELGRQAGNRDLFQGAVIKKNESIRWTGIVNLDESALDLPLRWTEPHTIIVNSMGDLFHEDIPFDVIRRIYQVMLDTPQHNYQILTKRPRRMLEFYQWWQHNKGPFTDAGSAADSVAHIWMGVSIEDQDAANRRIPYLFQVPAGKRFVAVEPFLAVVDLRQIPEIWIRVENAGLGLDWVIAGGEIGPGVRLMRPEWVRSLRDQCVNGDIPFYFKQWGGNSINSGVFGGRLLDGRTWSEMPR